MKIDLYHLYKHFEYSNFVYPIILDVLKVWAESIGVEAQVTVCKEVGVHLSTDSDVVAISVYTQTAPAAYRLSKKLRREGKIVILGGPHFRGQNYREASASCDIVVDTICENQWKSLLIDINNGKILPNHGKALYINDTERHFRYPNNFYEAFKNQKFYQIPSVPTSIGCPYNCEFCSPFLQGKYILRDAQTVYNEMAHIKGKLVFICDATFGLNKEYTIKLMKTLAPLRKKILVETTLSRLKNVEILNSMAEGGVKWISVGIESLSIKLSKHGGAKLEENIERIVDNAHKKGILVQGNFICGLDCDGPKSFDSIYQFYKNSNLDLIIIDLLTPYPNTEQYNRLRLEGRIIDANWENYDYRHVVFQPKKMSPQELIEGFNELYSNITRTSFMFKKAYDVYRNVGLTIEASIMISYNIFNRFDAFRKQKLLKENLNKILADNSLRGLSKETGSIFGHNDSGLN